MYNLTKNEPPLSISQIFYLDPKLFAINFKNIEITLYQIRQGFLRQKTELCGTITENRQGFPVGLKHGRA